MPLIMMCGRPATGKTKRASQIAAHFEEKGVPVVLINEESLELVRNDEYASYKQEKMMRGTLRDAVERELTKDTVVICDSLNYIKGFRYELFCIARALPTPTAVVYTECDYEAAVKYNQQRDEGQDSYSDEILEDLWGRMEVPNDKRKWDRPLWVVYEDAEVPLDELETSILQGEAPAPVMATALTTLTDSNFLHEIDKIVQDIITSLVQQQGQALPGDELTVPGADTRWPYTRKVTVSEMRRIKRQYLKVTQLNPPKDTSNVADEFVDFAIHSITE